MLIKALTVWQPHASLIYIKAKGIETRGWHTNYRGPLAIHAAKAFPKSARELCCEPVFSEALFGPGKYCYTSTLDLPLGAVIATCNLVDCVKVEQTDGLMAWLERGYVADDYEFPFGNYAPGRFGWILKDVRRLPEPIPAKGFQRLWNWEVPEGVLIA